MKIMNATSRMALAVVLAAGLAACDGSGSGHDGANHQAADELTVGDESDPYPASEMKMHEAMTSAVGADVSDTWVRKMIEHHKGAIGMAKLELARGYDSRVLPIARRLIAKQQQEVGELQALVQKDAAPDPVSAGPYRAAEKQMHEAMMAAKGADASHTFVRKMIPHHQGAIAMSQIVLAQGKDERVAAIARRIIADQEAEMAELQAILSGAGISPRSPAAPKPEPAAPAAASGNSQR
jgi:uncharacterized protein (DUF305 family)